MASARGAILAREPERRDVQYRDDGLPASRALRAGGLVGGTILATMLFYPLYAGALLLIEETTGLGEALQTSWLLLPLAVLTGLAASGVSLYGRDWLLPGGRTPRILLAGAVLLAFAVGTAIAGYALLAVAALGLREGQPLTTAFGVAGTLAIGWLAVRFVLDLRDGYRVAGLTVILVSIYAGGDAQ